MRLRLRLLSLLGLRLHTPVLSTLSMLQRVPDDAHACDPMYHVPDALWGKERDTLLIMLFNASNCHCDLILRACITHAHGISGAACEHAEHFGMASVDQCFKLGVCVISHSLIIGQRCNYLASM